MQCVSVRDDVVVSRLCIKAENNLGEENAKRNFFPVINQQPVTNSICNNFLVYSYNLPDEAIKKQTNQDFFDLLPYLNLVRRKSTGLTTLQKGGVALPQNTL